MSRQYDQDRGIRLIACLYTAVLVYSRGFTFAVEPDRPRKPCQLQCITWLGDVRASRQSCNKAAAGSTPCTGDCLRTAHSSSVQFIDSIQAVT